MWEIIRRVKGIPSDRIDLAISDMMRRTLEDKIVPFDEWQDLVEDVEEEMEDEPDIEAILQKHGLTLPELVEQAEAARKEFLDALDRYGLPLEDRLKLCRRIYEKVSEAPSLELLHLYCYIVCDEGFLLDIERAGDEGAVCWLPVKENADELYNYFSGRVQENLRFREILEKLKKIDLSGLHPGADASRHADEIFQTYTQIFNPVKNQEKFLDNITHLLQIADHAEELTPIKPLFLYRMLTRHKKRLQTSEALKVNFRTLWNYQEYNFERDNGKNFQTNMCYLKLFSRLCGIFQSDGAVDIPLCVCGFEQLSNLNEFYWTYVDPGWFFRIYTPEDFEIPFAPPVEDILNDSPFSCFEHGYDEDNAVMASNGISRKALDRFQSGRDRNCSRALDWIADYMNKNTVDLVTKFWGASPEEAKTLCAGILEASELPSSQQPKTAQDTALFLAAINGGLMEAVDGLAMEYLTAAGRILIHE